MLLFLWRTFYRDDLTRMVKQERLHPASRDPDQTSSCTVIVDLSFPAWGVLMGLLLNAIEDLPSAVVIEGDLRPAVSALVQFVSEGSLHMGSSTIESSQQGIN
jgi:hypothetical protein